MLTAEERQEIEAEMAQYPTKEAVCIDAMKIVQRHRGWVSDESIRDIGELLACVACGSGQPGHVLQPDLPQTGWAARDHALRQRELLDHGLRPHARAPGRDVWGSGSGKPRPTTGSRCCPSCVWERANRRRP